MCEAQKSVWLRVAALRALVFNSWTPFLFASCAGTVLRQVAAPGFGVRASIVRPDELSTFSALARKCTRRHDSTAKRGKNNNKLNKLNHVQSLVRSSCPNANAPPTNKYARMTECKYFDKIARTGSVGRPCRALRSPLPLLAT